MNAKWRKVEEEYCWATTQVEGLSCCGRTGYIVLELRSGHTERGLPQRTAVSVRCEMLHSKQTLLTIIF